jgi:general secretion pathway protein G
MHKRDQDLRSEDGFTLIEILVVVAIIGLLMTYLATNLIGRSEGAKRELARVQITKLEQTLELYKLDNGRYPTSEQGLNALVSAPTSEPLPRRYPSKGYVKRADLEDPWGVSYQYVAPGSRNQSSFDIFSFGPDQVQGGEAENADIGNWDTQSG